MLQGKDEDKYIKDDDVGKYNLNLDEENLKQRSARDDQGHMKGVFGNPGEMRKDINIMKEQMQDIRREFEHLSKTNRGEKTLGQHLDRLSNVIGNVEEVKNLMKRVPPLEAKNRAIDQLVKDMQKKMEILENRVEGTENVLKELSDQSCSILKAMAENIKNFLDKLE